MVHLVQMIAQVFHTTRSVCVAVYYWFYSYVHTYLQAVSDHVCKPFLGAPQSVITPTATTNIITVITSSSCTVPLCSPSSNTIFSPATILDNKPSSQHHLVQFNFKNSDSSLSKLQLIHRDAYLYLLICLFPFCFFWYHNTVSWHYSPPCYYCSYHSGGKIICIEIWFHLVFIGHYITGFINTHQYIVPKKIVQEYSPPYILLPRR